MGPVTWGWGWGGRGTTLGPGEGGHVKRLVAMASEGRARSIQKCAKGKTLLKRGCDPEPGDVRVPLVRQEYINK